LQLSLIEKSKHSLPAALVGVVAFAMAPQAQAGLLSIRPITLVSGPGFDMTITGTITTIDATSTISDWNVVVTTVEHLAHYSNANTRVLSADGVTTDGAALSVSTDGGSLLFRSPNPFLDFGASPADFAITLADKPTTWQEPLLISSISISPAA
jgi:hypothetical protein